MTEAWELRRDNFRDVTPHASPIVTYKSLEYYVVTYVYIFIYIKSMEKKISGACEAVLNVAKLLYMYGIIVRRRSLQVLRPEFCCGLPDRKETFPGLI